MLSWTVCDVFMNEKCRFARWIDVARLRRVAFLLNGTMFYENNVGCSNMEQNPLWRNNRGSSHGVSVAFNKRIVRQNSAISLYVGGVWQRNGFLAFNTALSLPNDFLILPVHLRVIARQYVLLEEAEATVSLPVSHRTSVPFVFKISFDYRYKRYFHQAWNLYERN